MTIGQRLKSARKKNGLSQEELAKLIGVSRGVITNIEYDKITEPQPIIVGAIVNVLKISSRWLITGEGGMEDDAETLRSAKVLSELSDVMRDFSEDELLYMLDVVKAMKLRLGDKTDGQK